MPVHAYALTHPGVRRASNEDSYAARPDLGFWVVCDGMGGHAAGEVASRLAAETIEQFVEASDRVDAATFTWPFGYDTARGPEATRLTSAFRLANHAIGVRAQDDPSLRGMATTAVALLLGDGAWRGQPGIPARHETAGPPDERPAMAMVAHLGDSRAYLYREARLWRITRDHSWVAEQIASGQLTEADGRSHPWRNMVTRALTGGATNAVPDLTPVELDPGDRLLLCSDGLSSAIDDPVIQALLAADPPGDVAEACERLVEAANLAGGPDNITVVVVEVV